MIISLLTLLQSRIDIPDGFSAVIYPSPRASRYGIIAQTEHVFSDNLLSARSNTVLIEISNRLDHMCYRPRDLVSIEKGQILGVLKFTRKT